MCATIIHLPKDSDTFYNDMSSSVLPRCQRCTKAISLREKRVRCKGCLLFYHHSCMHQYSYTLPPDDPDWRCTKCTKEEWDDPRKKPHCGTCKYQPKVGPSAVCRLCQRRYGHNCSKLKLADLRFLAVKPAPWTCPECKNSDKEQAPSSTKNENKRNDSDTFYYDIQLQRYTVSLKCQQCTKVISPHEKKVRCKGCLLFYHVNCIYQYSYTVPPTDPDWRCTKCTKEEWDDPRKKPHCGTCKYQPKVGPSAVCRLCQRRYGHNCSKLELADLRFLAVMPAPWTCPECKNSDKEQAPSSTKIENKRKDSDTFHNDIQLQRYTVSPRCQRCTKVISLHEKRVRCKGCLLYYHDSCIYQYSCTLPLDDPDWRCTKCTKEEWDDPTKKPHCWACEHQPSGPSAVCRLCQRRYGHNCSKLELEDLRSLALMPVPWTCPNCNILDDVQPPSSTKNGNKRNDSDTFHNDIQLQRFSPKCQQCTKEISLHEKKVRCKGCLLIYHNSCIYQYSYTLPSDDPDWRCTKCTKKEWDDPSKKPHCWACEHQPSGPSAVCRLCQRRYGQNCSKLELEDLRSLAVTPAPWTCPNFKILDEVQPPSSTKNGTKRNDSDTFHNDIQLQRYTFSPKCQQCTKVISLHEKGVRCKGCLLYYHYSCMHQYSYTLPPDDPDWRCTKCTKEEWDDPKKEPHCGTCKYQAKVGSSAVCRVCQRRYGHNCSKLELVDLRFLAVIPAAWACASCKNSDKEQPTSSTKNGNKRKEGRVVVGRCRCARRVLAGEAAAACARCGNRSHAACARTHPAAAQPGSPDWMCVRCTRAAWAEARQRPHCEYACAGKLQGQVGKLVCAECERLYSQRCSGVGRKQFSALATWPAPWRCPPCRSKALVEKRPGAVRSSFPEPYPEIRIFPPEEMENPAVAAGGSKARGAEGGGTKAEAVEEEGTKAGEAKSAGSKESEVKSGGVKAGEVNGVGAKTGEVKEEGVKAKKVKSGGAKAKEVKEGDVKAKKVKSGGAKAKEVKEGDVKAKKVKSWKARKVEKGRVKPGEIKHWPSIAREGQRGCVKAEEGQVGGAKSGGREEASAASALEDLELEQYARTCGLDVTLLEPDEQAPPLPAPGPCVPQPSVPGPSVPQPSVPDTSVPGPSVPHPNVLGPSVSNPSVPSPSVPSSSVPDPSAPGPTVPQPNVPGPSAPESSVPHPSVPDPSAPVPSVLHPSVPDPSAPGPTVPQPNVPGPSVPHPSVPDPSAPGPTVPQPNVPGPSVPHPSAPGPTGLHPSVPGPSVPDPSAPGPNVPGPSVPHPSVPGPSVPHSNDPGPSVPDQSVPHPCVPVPCVPQPGVPVPRWRAADVLRALAAAARAHDMSTPRPLRQLVDKFDMPGHKLWEFWSQYREVCVGKLRALVAADTRPVVYLAPHEWTVVDAELRVQSERARWLVEDLSGESLWLLLQLAAQFRLEEAGPRELRLRLWVSALRRYREAGFSSSLLLLQRRWWELKSDVREQLTAACRREANPTPGPPPPPPHRLLREVANEFPHTVTRPQWSWRASVAAERVLCDHEDEIADVQTVDTLEDDAAIVRAMEVYNRLYKSRNRFNPSSKTKAMPKPHDMGKAARKNKLEEQLQRDAQELQSLVSLQKLDTQADKPGHTSGPSRVTEAEEIDKDVPPATTRKDHTGPSKKRKRPTKDKDVVSLQKLDIQADKSRHTDEEIDGDIQTATTRKDHTGPSQKRKRQTKDKRRHTDGPSRLTLNKEIDKDVPPATTRADHSGPSQKIRQTTDIIDVDDDDEVTLPPTKQKGHTNLSVNTTLQTNEEVINLNDEVNDTQEMEVDDQMKASMDTLLSIDPQAAQTRIIFESDDDDDDDDAMIIDEDYVSPDNDYIENMASENSTAMEIISDVQTAADRVTVSSEKPNEDVISIDDDSNSEPGIPYLVNDVNLNTTSTVDHSLNKTELPIKPGIVPINNIYIDDLPSSNKSVNENILSKVSASNVTAVYVSKGRICIETQNSSKADSKNQIQADDDPKTPNMTNVKTVTGNNSNKESSMYKEKSIVDNNSNNCNESNAVIITTETRSGIKETDVIDKAVEIDVSEVTESSSEIDNVTETKDDKPPTDVNAGKGPADDSSINVKHENESSNETMSVGNNTENHDNIPESNNINKELPENVDNKEKLLNNCETFNIKETTNINNTVIGTIESNNEISSNVSNTLAINSNDKTIKNDSSSSNDFDNTRSDDVESVNVNNDETGNSQTDDAILSKELPSDITNSQIEATASNLLDSLSLTNTHIESSTIKIEDSTIPNIKESEATILDVADPQIKKSPTKIAVDEQPADILKNIKNILKNDLNLKQDKDDSVNKTTVVQENVAQVSDSANMLCQDVSINNEVPDDVKTETDISTLTAVIENNINDDILEEKKPISSFVDKSKNTESSGLAAMEIVENNELVSKPNEGRNLALVLEPCSSRIVTPVKAVFRDIESICNKVPVVPLVRIDTAISTTKENLPKVDLPSPSVAHAKVGGRGVSKTLVMEDDDDDGSLLVEGSGQRRSCGSESEDSESESGSSMSDDDGSDMGTLRSVETSVQLSRAARLLRRMCRPVSVVVQPLPLELLARYGGVPAHTHPEPDEGDPEWMPLESDLKRALAALDAQDAAAGGGEAGERGSGPAAARALRRLTADLYRDLRAELAASKKKQVPPAKKRKTAAKKDKHKGKDKRKKDRKRRKKNEKRFWELEEEQWKDHVLADAHSEWIRQKNITKRFFTILPPDPNKEKKQVTKPKPVDDPPPPPATATCAQATLPVPPLVDISRPNLDHTYAGDSNPLRAGSISIEVIPFRRTNLGDTLHPNLGDTLCPNLGDTLRPNPGDTLRPNLDHTYANDINTLRPASKTIEVLPLLQANLGDNLRPNLDRTYEDIKPLKPDPKTLEISPIRQAKPGDSRPNLDHTYEDIKPLRRDPRTIEVTPIRQTTMGDTLNTNFDHIYKDSKNLETRPMTSGAQPNFIIGQSPCFVNQQDAKQANQFVNQPAQFNQPNAYVEQVNQMLMSGGQHFTMPGQPGQPGQTGQGGQCAQTNFMMIYPASREQTQTPTMVILPVTISINQPQIIVQPGAVGPGMKQEDQAATAKNEPIPGPPNKPVFHEDFRQKIVNNLSRFTPTIAISLQNMPAGGVTPQATPTVAVPPQATPSVAVPSQATPSIAVPPQDRRERAQIVVPLNQEDAQEPPLPTIASVRSLAQDPLAIDERDKTQTYYTHPRNLIRAPPKHISEFMDGADTAPFALMRLDTTLPLWTLPTGHILLTDSALECRHEQYYAINSRRAPPCPVQFRRAPDRRSRISVKAFAKMPADEVIDVDAYEEEKSLELVAGDNKIFKKLCDNPPIYARVLTGVVDPIAAAQGRVRGLHAYRASDDSLVSLRGGRHDRALAAADAAVAHALAASFNQFLRPGEVPWHVVDTVEPAAAAGS